MRKRNNQSRINYGDSRVLFESKLTKPFIGPAGIKHNTGAVVRGHTFIEIKDKNAGVSLPSMAEIVFTESEKNLKKASKIKSKAMKTEYINGSFHIVDEQAFYLYMQLCIIGILGLYCSLESMVYELYMRRFTIKPVIVDDKELSFSQFKNLGYKRKITSVASQLSGKDNIFGSELYDYADSIKDLRAKIQHWDLERRENYFTNLPADHPLKLLVKIDPQILSSNVRKVLDHYSLS